ncbi:MAG: transglycosylase domain-containing protein [Anaerolineae bacterium]|nr:transglycosylase domain-containing protein [Anaerolineae bacterium]
MTLPEFPSTPSENPEGNNNPPSPENNPGERLRNLLSATQNSEQSDAETRSGKDSPENKQGWYAEGELPSAPLVNKSEQILIDKAEPVNMDVTRVYRPENMETDATIPPLGQTVQSLPVNRPPEVDPAGTRVIPVKPLPTRPAQTAGAQRTGGQATMRAPSTQQPRQDPHRTPVIPASAFKNPGKDNENPSPFKANLGCFIRGFVFSAFFAAVIVLVLISVTVFQYFSLINSADFPDVNNLKEHASQFETTKIYDRNGNLLYELLDPNAGRRTYVQLEKISPYVIAATIATEDKEYYNHAGFDPVAIGRALWQNYTTGDVVSGASTITQQLARALLLSSSERFEKTVQRKAKEIALAAEITRKYSKEEILELYLNENNYGNMAYGIEAAAETYFHTTADKLTLGQAAFLAGIPQAPSVYDVINNRDVTLQRQKQVLILMYQTSKEKNCISVSTNVSDVCVPPEDVLQAVKEIDEYQFSIPENNMQHPHWVNYIRSVLEQQFGSQTIYMSGFSVVTTLDNDLQQKAEEIVHNQVATLVDKNVKGGALVAIEPATGQILAMVGSPDFNNDVNSGQVNMAISPRQPGSSIKPLTYAAAFEKGWTPSTLIWDIPSEFPPSGLENDNLPPYVPVNYDGRFHGPVTVRDALANSYNIPAVKALQFVGVYDNPNTPEADGLINFAKRLGITTLTRDDYGLALTLGGGDVSLLELTSAFGTFGNRGVHVSPVSILKIVNYKGETVYEYQQPTSQQVVRPEHAYLISSILSDNQARSPMFGSNSVLNLPFTAAVKTGTTNDFRDNWTIGYTPDLVAGVWVGNPDYTPMNNTTGVTGAAPIWSEFMQYAIQKLKNGQPTPFYRPDSIQERIICAFSGTEPSEWCPSQKSEIFAVDQLPQNKDKDLWQQIKVDTWTGNRASSACSDFTEDKFVLGVSDKKAQKWIKETDQGRAWVESIGFKDDVNFVPEKDCTLTDARPNIYFSNLTENQTISSSPLDIYAIANASANFSEFKIEYGQGDDPHDWKELAGGIKQMYDHPEKIYTWDLADVPSGKVTLRIYMKSTEENRYAEKRVHLNIMVPTRTATQAPTFTLTPTLTPVTPTNTSVPPTNTSVPPTNTPVPPTSTPSETPVVTVEVTP